MKRISSKEKIISAIRKALVEKNEERYPNLDFESSIFYEPTEHLDITFAQNLTEVQGKFIYCEDKQDFYKNFVDLMDEENWDPIFCVEEALKNILSDKNIPYETNLDLIDDDKSIGLTTCEYLIARTGSVMVSTGQLLSRKIFTFPPIHVVVAYTSQLVYDLDEALTGIKERYNNNLPSLITTVTGPSRTADIEKTLIMGAHGPKELYVFMIDDK